MQAVRKRITTIATLLLLMLASVALYLPTVYASRFEKSFLGNADTLDLKWLPRELNKSINAESESLGLASSCCGGYVPKVQPATLEDIVLCRRRVLLRHEGNWFPIDSEMRAVRSNPSYVKLRDRCVAVSVSLFGAHVVHLND